jgi:hypothetical protein
LHPQLIWRSPFGQEQPSAVGVTLCGDWIDAWPLLLGDIREPFSLPGPV